MHMIVDSYNFWLSGALWIDTILSWLAGCRTFPKQHHNPRMYLQIRMHAVCRINPPFNGIHWLCLQGQLHTLHCLDVMYHIVNIPVVVLVSIADSRGKEIHARIEVGPWPAADKNILSARVRNRSACTRINVLPSYCTVNRWLTAEVSVIPFMFSVAASRMPLMCLCIVIYTFPLVL